LSSAQIVASILVKNEDLFVEEAVRNITGFCDRIIISDHHSTDGTWKILQRLAEEFPSIDLARIGHPRDSHTLIQPLANSKTWIFGVDGDEIYDPAGLLRLRSELLAGRYDDWWVLFGNVLNCVALDRVAGTASGYLAPPSRSMTKLYNFDAITAWDGPCTLRLAAGTIRFKPPFDAARRADLHKQLAWEDSHYRCLHTCFLRRSSLDDEQPATRPNVSENSRGGITTFLRKAANRLTGQSNASDWKREKYARGELVTMDATNFFPPA
jgi:hypothetical protein